MDILSLGYGGTAIGDRHLARADFFLDVRQRRMHRQINTDWHDGNKLETQSLKKNAHYLKTRYWRSRSNRILARDHLTFSFVLQDIEQSAMSSTPQGHFDEV